MESNKQIVITCEHAGNQVPEPYGFLFRGREQILKTHRGFDPGALELAEWCAARLDTTSEAHLITRLLVDVNRSVGSRSLFSEFTSHLPEKEKQLILNRWYEPYRRHVEEHISDVLVHGQGKALHLGVHTFTNTVGSKVRDADIGLLYDSSRAGEKKFCEIWRSLLTGRSSMNVRFNYPYRGTADGLITCLRKRFPADRYLGVELEVNQKLLENDSSTARQVREIVAGTLMETVEELKIRN